MVTWRRTLLEHSQAFLKWMDDHHKPELALTKIAEDLEAFIKDRVKTAEEARQFWSVIPDVRAACNLEGTYEKMFAAEAYAYVHLLDRYWRTFDVLRELISRGALPIAKDGIRVLDVGTGPGPTPYAIQDFYALVQTYGQIHREETFIGQNVRISVVERSKSMQGFLHRFSELSRRPGPFGSERDDFMTLDFPRERKEYERQLRREEWYEPESGDYFEAHTPAEANWIAQSLYRYRFVIFSNFFTVGEVVNTFERQISRLFSDLRYGGTVVVLSATGGHYGAIHDHLTELALDSGLRPVPEVTPTLGADDSYTKVAEIIKITQNRIYRHLVELSGPPELQRGKAWPDYWSPKPHPDRKTEFALRVYRKGKWPSVGSGNAGVV